MAEEPMKEEKTKPIAAKPKTQVKKPVQTKKTTPKKPTTTSAKPKTTKKETKKPAEKKTENKSAATKPKTQEKPAETKKPVETKKPTLKKEEKPEETKDEKEEDAKSEGKYVVKKKPVLSKDIKEKLSKRKQIKNRTPEFIREEWFRYKRIPHNWRRPDGITSKMRINLKYRPSKVRVGFRGPRDVRGLHSSGFEEIFVYNVNDVQKLDPKTQAARIGGTVGTKKRIEIEKKAEEMNIRILNV